MLTELVTTPRMHERFALAELPAHLDWRMKDGHSYTTESRNQHIPKYCGSCYAFGSVTAFADRILIARGLGSRQVIPAVQVVLNCDQVDFGCSGGDPSSVYKFISEIGGLPEETCQPYEAVGHDTGRSCRAQDVCQRCGEAGCVAVPRYQVFGLAEYGQVAGEFQMLAELQRGPIACAISTPDSFLRLADNRIFFDPSNDTAIDHIISVVGYGEEDGTKYWVLRNSWGTYWGYYGWARISRGLNTIMIETQCAWATPANEGQPVWHEADLGKEETHEEVALEESESPDATPCRPPRNDWAAAGGEVLRGRRSHEAVAATALPRAWDWRNVSGVSYVSANTNQHLPYGTCASCWAQAVTSVLADRIAVIRGGAWPQIHLSAQMLVNCAGAAGCGAGDAASAYAFVYEHGITDETCQNYQGKELTCNGAGVCLNCAPAGEHGLHWPGNCVAVERPLVWSLSEFGAARGAAEMKPEIYRRGPIGCGIEASPRFREYKGGILSEVREWPRLNHQVSLAGWGKEKGAEFWIGRNSYGSYWGEDGWFRILMHRDNLGVELDCDWGVPTEGAPTSVRAITEIAVPEAAERVAAAAGSPWLLCFLVLGAALTSASCMVRRAWVSQQADAYEPPAPYVRVA